MFILCRSHVDNVCADHTSIRYNIIDTLLLLICAKVVAVTVDHHNTTAQIYFHEIHQNRYPRCEFQLNRLCAHMVSFRCAIILKSMLESLDFTFFLHLKSIKFVSVVLLFCALFLPLFWMFTAMYDMSTVLICTTWRKIQHYYYVFSNNLRFRFMIINYNVPKSPVGQMFDLSFERCANMLDSLCAHLFLQQVRGTRFATTKKLSYLPTPM